MVDDKGYNLAFHSTLFVQEQRFRCPATSPCRRPSDRGPCSAAVIKHEIHWDMERYSGRVFFRELILHSDPLDGGRRLAQTERAWLVGDNVESSGEIENLC